MSFEVEQKFRLADPAAFEARLARIAASIEPAVLQVDQYFAHPARDFATSDEALRIRSVGEQNWVTYKGPKIDATTKTRREIEIAIESGSHTASRYAEMLVALGFRPVAAVRKQRRYAACTWQGRTVEVVLDDVEGVGQFCEIELTAEESDLDAARGTLASLAQELGLTKSERRSYLEMLLAGP